MKEQFIQIIATEAMASDCGYMDYNSQFYGLTNKGRILQYFEIYGDEPKKYWKEIKLPNFNNDEQENKQENCGNEGVQGATDRIAGCAG